MIKEPVRYLCFACRKKADDSDVGVAVTNNNRRKCCDGCGAKTNDLRELSVEEYHAFWNDNKSSTTSN